MTFLYKSPKTQPWQCQGCVFDLLIVNISLRNGYTVFMIQFIDDLLFFHDFFIDDIDEFMIKISVPDFAVLFILNNMEYF